MLTNNNQEINQLVKDLRAVMHDAEQLLNAISGQTGDKIAALRTRTEDHLQRIRQKLGDMENKVLHNTKEAVLATDRFVHGNPWRSILAASGIGLLFGILAARR